LHPGLGKDERPDRGVVLHRAGDAHHDDAIDSYGVQQPGGGLGRQLGSHPGHDGDDLAVAERPRGDGYTGDLGPVQRQLAGQGPQLHRHGADEGCPGRLRRCVHGGYPTDPRPPPMLPRSSVKTRPPTRMLQPTGSSVPSWPTRVQSLAPGAATNVPLAEEASLTNTTPPSTHRWACTRETS